MLLVFLINPRVFISCTYNYSLNGDFANSYISNKIETLVQSLLCLHFAKEIFYISFYIDLEWYRYFPYHSPNFSFNFLFSSISVLICSFKLSIVFNALFRSRSFLSTKFSAVTLVLLRSL